MSDLNTIFEEMLDANIAFDSLLNEEKKMILLPILLVIKISGKINLKLTIMY